MPRRLSSSTPHPPTSHSAVCAVLGEVQSRPPPKLPPLPSSPNLSPTQAPVLVWFRGHDLRVEDHFSLDAAIKSRAPILALYVLEQGWETDGVAAYMSKTSSEPSLCSNVSAPDSPFPVTDANPDASPHQIGPLTSSPQSNYLDYPASTKHSSSWGPQSPNGGFTLGRIQRWYLHHSLSVLQKELSKLGITLMLTRADNEADAVQQVVKVAKNFAVSTVLWNKRYKPHLDLIDSAARTALENSNISVYDLASECLIEPYSDESGSFDDFQSYMRFWMDCMRMQPPAAPRGPISPEQVNTLSRDAVRSLLYPVQTEATTSQSNSGWELCLDVDSLNILKGIDVDGKYSPGDLSNIGCVAAKQTLQNFLSGDHFCKFASGLARRDGLVSSKNLATSHLSPHVRFGEISPRVLFHSVIQVGYAAKMMGESKGVSAARTFIKNMCLKEFGCYTLHRYPAAASKPIMPEFEVFPWAEDKDGSLKRAWQTGTTGFPILDAAMRQLIREGWIHNSMRFLAATFFCKYLLLPWPMGAAHMVRALVDGDEGCNTLGWQWTVGCNTDSFPFSTLVNPVYLYNNTQSKKDAAAYVKKYVPELSSLPDNLVFTPWKASRKQQKLAKLSLVQHCEYRTMGISKDAILYGNGEAVTLYPTRIVSGPVARARARNAMEVMRRIFASQRQCRTLVVDQMTKDLYENRTRSSTHALTSSTSTMSSCTVSEVTEPATDARVEIVKVRLRDESPSDSSSRLRKRRRVSEVDCANQRDSCSIAELVPTDGEVSRENREETSVKDIHGSSQVMKHGKSNRRQFENVDSTSSPSIGRDSRRASGTEDNAKRPRPRSLSKPHSSDERLSVYSLVNKTQPQDCNFKRSSPYMVVASRSNLSASPHQRIDGTPLPGNSGQMSMSPSDSYALPSVESRDDRIIPAPLGHRPDANGAHNNIHMPYPSTPNVHQHVNSGGAFRGIGQAVTPSPYAGFQSPIPLPQGGQNHLHESVIQRSGRSMDYRQDMSGTPCGRNMHGHSNGQKNLGSQQSSYVGQQTAAELRMFHPSLQQSPYMAGTFVQPQAQNQRMVVYGNPGAQVPLPPVNYQPGIAHVANNSQNYLSVPPGNSHMNPAGGQVIWYQPMSPYVDMRFHTQGGSNIPGLMRAGAHSGQEGIQIGYESMVGGSSIGVGMEASAVARQGPSTPGERISIARKMAAMDYKDETLGGKNWEQWQAIALHLLNQYEFSEDTDRQTSKAYVRLCVLKDELRDANPTGPRVTVNHCKEVFRILRLPVTGEWDRRGHGGVRGPYCYGCVKRRPHP